jgi:alpha-L-rhamnosidase
MKLLIPLLISAVIVLTPGCAKSPSSVSIYDLRCENLSDPAGIATVSPGLSWKIRSLNNGTYQKAFQIIIASSPGLLNEENADLWNSGKTLSSSSVAVPYNGNPLRSRSMGYWKVRVWDGSGRMSGWSNTAFFSIGLVEKADWQSSYIGYPGKESGIISPIMRKTFNLQGKGEKIFLHVNSLGYHEIYLNGRRVGDKVLTPAVSQFNKRSQAITYDITGLSVEGRNDIAIWLGRGWYTKGLPGVAHDGPLVRAQIEEYDNGSWKNVAGTDSSWSCRKSGYSAVGSWRSGDYGGEEVDGSLLIPDMSSQSLDSVSWQPVIVAIDPGYEVTPQMSEQNSIIETIKADTIMPAGRDAWLTDMGKTLTGFATVRFSGLKPGQKVLMEYGDHLDDKGNIADQGQSDIYIAAGKSSEMFSSRFNYHGFRYIRISNLETEPVKEDITASLIQTGYNIASSFECSDPDLNKIHDMIFYTLRCLSLGGYLVDCPQIERLGYGGDGNASTATAQTMFDLAPLYTNWLQAWADCIRPDGGMPHTAPNPYPAGGGPYWCGFIITASWKTYVNYGDIRVLEKYYPIMQKWLGYVEKYSPSGLLQPWPETDYRGWYLGDWAVPEGTDQTNKTSVNLVNNCFISVCYGTMQKIAGVLGKEAESKAYSVKKEQIGKLINDNLFDASSHFYGSGSQIDLTYPLLADIVPDTLKGIVRKNLVNEIVNNHDGHFACGLVGIPVFTEWAIKEGESALMYSMLKKSDYPGYLYMIGNGATTTWEHWNGARSRIHNCYNGIGTWFYQALGGLMPDENSPGYRHFSIDPQVTEGISWVNISKETPYGTVSVRWKLEEGVMKMDVNIPFGSGAEVIIPSSAKRYILNGKSHKNLKSSVGLQGGKYSISYIKG